MILIADSGSTKCDWCLVDKNGEEKSFSTMGINPFFHNEKVIADRVRNNEALAAHAGEVKAIFFYCAGGSSKRLKQIVEKGLSQVFSTANVHVDHDLVAAAVATYNDKPCISCILGTGSNSVYFDGHTLSEEVPALAYILGDEGSGSYYGKQFLKDFLYKRLPSEISEAFVAEYGIGKDEVFENVYQKPHANVYLASFMKFITKYKEHEYVHNMVKAGMEEFLSTHVLCFKNYKEVETHFVGSIGHYYLPVLKEVATSLGVNLGTVIKKPIDGLVEYHKKTTHSKLTS